MSRIDVRTALPPFFGKWTAGQVYFNGQTYAATTHATNLNQLRCSPLIIPNAVQIAKIGAEITTAGAATAAIRLGIFADDGNCYPGDLVLDAGTIDGTSQTVQDIVLGALLDLTPDKLYWSGFASQGAVCTIRAHAAQTYPIPISPGTSKPAAGTLPATYVQTGVSGALPSTFTTSRTVGAAGSAGRIHLTVAA